MILILSDVLFKITNLVVASFYEVEENKIEIIYVEEKKRLDMLHACIFWLICTWDRAKFAGTMVNHK